MTRPTLPGRTIPLLGSAFLGREAPVSTGDQDEPIDRLRTNGMAFFPVRVLLGDEPEEDPPEEPGP
jgi:hypothetical protein